MTEIATKFVTPAVLELFLDYARDAGNWSGSPLINGNVGGGASDRGLLTNMKKAGLIETFPFDGFQWIDFLPNGIALAKEHGVDLSWI